MIINDYQVQLGNTSTSYCQAEGLFNMNGLSQKRNSKVGYKYVKPYYYIVKQDAHQLLRHAKHFNKW